MLYSLVLLGISDALQINSIILNLTNVQKRSEIRWILANV